jgi:hypothetical protein
VHRLALLEALLVSELTVGALLVDVGGPCGARRLAERERERE